LLRPVPVFETVLITIFISSTTQQTDTDIQTDKIQLTNTTNRNLRPRNLKLQNNSLYSLQLKVEIDMTSQNKGRSTQIHKNTDKKTDIKN